MSCPFSSGSGPAPHPIPSQTSVDNNTETAEEATEAIPQPPEHLFGLLGNIGDVDPSFPVRSFWKLSDLYGPIFKLRLRQENIVVSTQKLVNELCDTDRFEKVPNVTLREVRALLGDGLFTAFNTEMNWWAAHRILIPSFGPLGIRKMFPQMMDIASQMILKWDRSGYDHEIETTDDLTRLAFDTIGLCAFNYRFNGFYGEKPPQFAQQMAYVLLESGKRGNRPALINKMHYYGEQERQENIRQMHELCDAIIQERKRNPQPEVNDLLNAMLNGKDSETGEGLSDENIRYNMCTFLVAGHETTSGTLSFAYYQLLKHPDKLHKAQQQVDEIVGDNPLKVEHLPKLDYLDAVIKETLRLTSPIGVLNFTPKKATKLAGKYKVTRDQNVIAVINKLHRDPEVWGDDAEEFRPERFLNGGFEKLPPNSWKPFGNGMRACIGRGFAEQEMIINLALVLQRFQIEMADPSYELIFKATLTIKPEGFNIRVRRRPGKSMTVGLSNDTVSKSAKAAHGGEHSHQDTSKSNTAEPQFNILYGGNSGTCKGFAESLETEAADRGVKATVSSLDSGTENLSIDKPVIIVTASYEGKPPDNARKFVSWLDQMTDDGALKGVKYALFGVGNSDWPSTFHRIPKLIDAKLQKLGATPVLDSGFTDVKRDPVGPWEDWQEKLWDALSLGDKTGTEATAPTLSVSVKPNPVKSALGGEETSVGTVLASYEIADTSVGPAKRHTEILLPDGMEYTAGDYLVVVPRNPPEIVSRVLKRFDLASDDLISITGSSKKFLPSIPTPAAGLLSTAVELSVPITRRQLDTLIAHASSEQKSGLESLKNTFDDLIAKRFSILDVLLDHPVTLPFGVYLDMLPPLIPRQYSISSSPLQSPSTTLDPLSSSPAQTVSLTYDVIAAPSWAHPETTPFHGVASNYLASLKPGDRLPCYVRPTRTGFRLPSDPATPVIMIAAGTGLAPMRGFLKERAAIRAAGQKKLGPAVLFFGCRDPEKDFIYRDELRRWEEEGVVKVYTAFSRKVEAGEEKGRYVQDVIWEKREVIKGLYRSEAKILICGSARGVGKGAADIIKKIYLEVKGGSEEEADRWLDEVREVRYVSDVF